MKKTATRKSQKYVVGWTSGTAVYGSKDSSGYVQPMTLREAGKELMDMAEGIRKHIKDRPAIYKLIRVVKVTKVTRLRRPLTPPEDRRKGEGRSERHDH